MKSKIFPLKKLLKNKKIFPRKREQTSLQSTYLIKDSKVYLKNFQNSITRRWTGFSLNGQKIWTDIPIKKIHERQKCIWKY